jgi:hypothetical protein
VGYNRKANTALAISSLFPLLERDFGFSKAQLGLIGRALMWVYAASVPLAGYAGYLSQDAAAETITTRGR